VDIRRPELHRFADHELHQPYDGGTQLIHFLTAAAFNATFAHEPRHVTAYLLALDEVFQELHEAIATGDIAGRIGSPVKHIGFRRLT